MEISNELFRFADNMRCREYYFDTVEGVRYVRPVTSMLYKRIDVEKSKEVYEHMIDYNKQFKRPYNNADVSHILKEFENCITVFEETEFEILEHKVDVLRRYFTCLHNDMLNDAMTSPKKYVDSDVKANLGELDPEADEFADSEETIRQNENKKEQLLQKMKSCHYLSRTMDIFLEHLLIMDLPLELSMSSYYYESYFISYDFKKAFEVLADIGYAIQNKNLSDILNYSGWDDTEKKRIENMVLDFANSFGLLGVLSKIFHFNETGDQMYYSHRNELNKINVNTILNDAFLSADYSKPEGASTLTKLFAPESKLNPSMNIKDYIKIFFPDDRGVSFEAYQLQDERYWNVYSEPIYVFLLGVKIFHGEYIRYQNNHNNPEYGRNNSLLKQMPIVSQVNFSYNTVIEGYVMEYTFRTLLEGIIFYAKKQLIHSSNTTIYCEVCGKPVSGKNPKKKPKYCGKHCRESVSSGNYYKNNPDVIKERRNRKKAEVRVGEETE